MFFYDEKRKNVNMVKFKPLEIEDKEIFDKYYAIRKYIGSEYNFTTLFAWQEMYGHYYGIINNCLCVISRDGYMYPVGEKQYVKKAVEILLFYYR